MEIYLEIGSNTYQLPVEHLIFFLQSYTFLHSWEYFLATSPFKRDTPNKNNGFMSIYLDIDGDLVQIGLILSVVALRWKVGVLMVVGVHHSEL